MYSVVEENTGGLPYYLNCTNLTAQQFRHMTIIRSTVALISIAVLVVMLVFLCLSKAYRSLVQRLLIYLIGTTVLSETFQACNLEYIFQFSHQDLVCTILGFLTNWVDHISSLHALSIIFWTIILAFIHFNYPRYSSVRLPICWKIAIDFLYLLMTALLPVLVIWMPLRNGNYGNAVAWCWIRLFDEDCKGVGFLDPMVAGYGIHGAMGVVGIFAIAGVTIAICRLSANFVHVKALLLRSLGLASIAVLFFLTVLMTYLTISVYSAIHDQARNYALWLFHVTAMPLFHLVIPFGVFGSFYFNHFRDRFCKKSYRPRQQQQVEEDRKGTAPTSDRQTAPSNTYFSVPYTNGFTSIRDNSETAPLVKENKRKHVSFV